MNFQSGLKIAVMKKILKVVLCAWILSGCSVLKKKEKYGCPTNGKNIGAERLLSGDKDAIKAARKAKKFKS
jgi:hypothetical protein